jgi:steroid delta-isomerase-like uncharacterized protein
MSAQDNAKMMQTFYDAYNTRDFDRGVALAGEDLKLTQVAFGTTYQGPEGIRPFFELWAGAFPDSKAELVNVVAGEDGVTAEGIFRGTQQASLQSPSGDIPATGRRVEIPHCFVFGITNGKLASGRLYFDAASLMRQLGVMVPVQ